jgi:hypothetical protein
VSDATILIPTHRHAALLPYSLRSALGQEGVDLEVFVIGDGVEDDTREALEPFLADPRVRFFDFPKGERHGERLRHEALAEAQGRIVCYLSDDDLLLADHAHEMARLLGDADFAHSAPFQVLTDGSLQLLPVDLSRPEFRQLVAGSWNAIVLTGSAHTLESYRRLPHGWRPAPQDIYTDHYMWQQFVALPGFRGRTGMRLTHLHFPDTIRRGLSTAERVTELESWWRRMHEPGFDEELGRMTAAETWRIAVARTARVQELRATIREMEATRSWWAREKLLSLPLLRRLRAKRGAAR